MDPIGSFSGLSSGIQWRDMIGQMMQIEISRRMTPAQTQLNAAQKRKDAWNTFSGLLAKFRASAQALQNGNAFGAMGTSVGHSPTTKGPLFTATPSVTAVPGSYKVEVLGLAKADKLSGAAVASSTAALGHTGEFYVNGKRVEIAATDTLATLRDSINAANTGTNPSGVSATILSTSATEHRLVLTSVNTGVRGLELTDGDTGVLQSLGITTGALVQNTDPSDPGSTQSQRLASTSSTLAAMLGVSAPPAVTTIDIDGRKITVDLLNDTMLSLMNRIAAQGGTASIKEEVVAGKTMHRLTVGGEVTADAASDDPAASQRIVELLGFQTGVRSSPITTGEDARLEIDGFAMTRRTNVVSDAIGGVTLNLTVAEPGTQIDLVVSRDLGEIVNAAQSMAAAYNELVAFTASQRTPGSPLATNGSLRSTMTSLSRSLLQGVASLPSTNPYTHASIAGIELTKDGKLQVDAAKLQSALETNLADVKALLSQSGAVSDAEVRYVGSTAKSAPGAYAVEITAPALQATHLGSVWADANAYAASDGVSDTLTFTDSVSGRTTDYVLAQGKSLTDAVAEMNARFSAEGLLLKASEEGGALRVSATEFGSVATFTLAGGAAAVLGMTEDTFAGSDVSGTIGGLAATGVGQVLTGADGEATEGLAIRYEGTTARSAGEVRFSLGVGGTFERLLEPTIRANDGIIPTQVTALDRSIESLNKRLDDIESRLEVRRLSLIRQFTRMESAMSLLQSQGNWLASQIQSMQAPRNR